MTISIGDYVEFELDESLEDPISDYWAWGQGFVSDIVGGTVHVSYDVRESNEQSEYDCGLEIVFEGDIKKI